MTQSILRDISKSCQNTCYQKQTFSFPEKGLSYNPSLESTPYRNWCNFMCFVTLLISAVLWQSCLFVDPGLERVAEELMGRRRWREVCKQRSLSPSDLACVSDDWQPIQDLQCCFCDDSGLCLEPATVMLRTYSVSNSFRTENVQLTSQSYREESCYFKRKTFLERQWVGQWGRTILGESRQ